MSSRFFVRHEGEIFFEGQVRQTPGHQHWAIAMGHQHINGPWAGNPTGLEDKAGGTVTTYQCVTQRHTGDDGCLVVVMPSLRAAASRGCSPTPCRHSRAPLCHARSF